MNCTYCYYLCKKSYYSDNETWQISDELLERFIQQYIQEQEYKEIRFTWQGGEPTFLGLRFFQRAIELQKKYCLEGKSITNDLQTNGTLLDNEWCKFLHDNNFLVGLSIDGPKKLHDKYRNDINNQSTFDTIANTAKLLRKHKVEFNTLTVVNRINAKQPLDVYKFLRNEIESKYMQFIPCIEPKEFSTISPQHWDKDKLPEIGHSSTHPGTSGSVVTDWSVDSLDYGYFLCRIFDRWHTNDIGKIFILNFEASLNRWMGKVSPICCFNEICGKSLALEHDGSIYSCDHYVYPEYILGNIKNRPLSKIAFSERQIRFGLSKNSSLPQFCSKCSYLFACNGECPKNRFLRTPDGEYGLNYLCTGLKKYFSFIDPYMHSLSKKIKTIRQM